MPRSNEGEEKPKTAPRKRATTRARMAKKAPVKRTPRKPTATKTVKRVTSPAPKTPEPPSRKSPTPIATTKANRRSARNTVLIAAAVVLLGIGGSAAIGFSDAGQIDVAKTIEDRNERIKQAGTNTAEKTITVPVQNTSNKADGGLRGLGIGTQKPAQTPQATSTASSTASTTSQTASSTDATETSIATEEVSTETTPEDTSEDSAADTGTTTQTGS